MNTGGERQISEANAKRIQAFKELITIAADAEILHKTLNKVYINYTRLLLQAPDKVNSNTDNELYYLSELIEILE
jgi:hypothetical protein